jgi:hypothetical protein
MENHWKHILKLMTDTQVTAYPDQYYVSRPDTMPFKIPNLHFSGVQEISHVFLSVLNRNFLSQIQPNVSSRLFNSKLLPNSKLLRPNKTDGNSNPRILAITGYILHEKCNSELSGKCECYQVYYMVQFFTFPFCVYSHCILWQQTVPISYSDTCLSGFGGLVVSMLPSATQVRLFKPGRSRRIFREKTSSSSLPSEGK